MCSCLLLPITHTFDCGCVDCVFQGLRVEMGAALAAGHADLEGREAAVKEAERRLASQQVRWDRQYDGPLCGAGEGKTCWDAAAAPVCTVLASLAWSCMPHNQHQQPSKAGTFLNTH